MNEAAVGLALWVECLGTLAAAAIAVGDAMQLGAPVVSGSGYVWAEIGGGWPPEEIGRAVIDG